MTAWKACIGCAHYRPDYVDDDGDTYGRCGLDDEIMAKLIERFGAHPRHDVGGDEIQGFRRQPPGLAHAFEIVRRMDFDRRQSLVVPLVVIVVVVHQAS